MPWKETSAEEIAHELNLNIEEVRQKQKLMKLIKDMRKKKKITQTQFATMLGVSQGRVAQIESGIGTARVTYDVLFRALRALGYDCKILPYIPKKQQTRTHTAFFSTRKVSRKTSRTA